MNSINIHYVMSQGFELFRLCIREEVWLFFHRPMNLQMLFVQYVFKRNGCFCEKPKY